LDVFERKDVMGAKISISLTDEHARLVDDAVASGDYASSSEVIRDALRDWRSRRLLGRLWDEGVASGRADGTETIEDIKRAARHRKSAG
jgi:antitoxin ParD1/3/4